jgi:hypothetical protein
LIRTPELIEDGLRSLLSAAYPEADVKKRRLMLGDSGLSVNPDLVFGRNHGVGDVKYRYLRPDWNRSDLNQLVTFATAFGSVRAALLGFIRDASDEQPRTVPVGPVVASVFAWNASGSVMPEDSEAQLTLQFRKWLDGTTP